MTASQESERNIGFYLIEADMYSPLIESAINDYKSAINSVKQQQTHSWHNSIQPLEEAAERLDRLWGLLDHVNNVANTSEIRNVYESLLTLITNFHTDIMQDEQIYNIYLEFSNSPEFAQLDQSQQTIIKNELRDFKLSGVALPADKRAEFKRVVENLSELENKYANNVLDATEGWQKHILPEQENLLAGLPQHTIDLAASKAKDLEKTGWVLTLDYPSYAAVMSHSENRELRRELYTAYSTRASDQGPNAGTWDNSPVLKGILDLREKIAKLVGYQDYAEYSLVPKMANDPAQVEKFLEDIIKRTKPQGMRELEVLKQFAKQQGHTEELAAWDVGYYSEMQMQKLYQISEEQLREYFPEPRVLTGMFKLVRQIFGLQIEEVADFIKWHDSIRMFKVIDKNNELRGYFYIDLYAREGKRGGAWMDECEARLRFANENLQSPIAYLNCNFAPPVEHRPGLLTHSDVTTLFHEFGHTLHHILTKEDYYSVSGMNGVAWDAIELPSQFMENWCWEWEVIQDISENINTGEPLSRDMFDRLLKTKNYQSAMFLLRQLEFSLFDFRIHRKSSADSEKDVHKILADVRQLISLIPPPDFNRFENSFTHIFSGGYACGYYSYLWAEVLSCDAFDLFRQDGLFDAKVGQRFMTQILERGGSKPAMDLFVAFAGREPEIDALLRHHAIA